VSRQAQTTGQPLVAGMFTRYEGQQRLDLHTHSTASDGVYTPGDLVRLAAVLGLGGIALTDHDSTEGVDEAIAAGERVGLNVIPGIEVNTDLPKGQGEAHLLGYFVAREEPAFQETLRFLREARAQRGQRIVANLRAAGVEIDWDRVRDLAHGAVGRPHVAQALIEAGYAANTQDAFDRYLTPGKPGYAPRFRLPAEDAIRFIRSAYGVPTLAHPAGIPGLEERLLPSLVAAGLQGLECYYGRYDDATVARLVGLANQHGLIPTGGTDYHGPDIHPTPLGSRYVPANAATLLRLAAGRNHAEPAPAFSLDSMR
jgi:predicted metal-dependent phosphoesterase TrpH